MVSDRRYLYKHGNQWIVRIKVPAALRGAIGKAHLKHPLHTDNLALANRLKHEHVARLKAELNAVEDAARRKAGLSVDPLVMEALEWSELIKKASSAPRTLGVLETGEEVVTSDREDEINALTDRAYELANSQGSAKAREFHQIAIGEVTPIVTLIDRWLTQVIMKPRQVIDYRRAVLKFDEWLLRQGYSATVQQVTRRVAGDYIHRAFVEMNVNVRTANKDISCLSSFWRWLDKRGFVEGNVWHSQSLSKPKTNVEVSKRPYTDDEIGLLFQGDPPSFLRDMMMVAALSGMRIEEIARLDGHAVAGGFFDVRDGKTKASIRRFPIHSALGALIERRVNAANLDDALFPELPIPRVDSPVERSQKAVKAFTRYRRKQQVDDVPAGARQSRVDFHSFRRWFITKAEQAGEPPHVISAVVGHSRSDMTLGVYSGGPSEEQMRSVVESVQLPPAKNRPSA